jgi:hypothetical protein
MHTNGEIREETLPEYQIDFSKNESLLIQHSTLKVYFKTKRLKPKATGVSFFFARKTQGFGGGFRLTLSNYLQAPRIIPAIPNPITM